MRASGQADRRAGGRWLRRTARLLAALAPGGMVVAASCADQGIRPATATSLADSADQVLFKMSATVTSDGVRRSQVIAETAFVYQGPQRMDLRQLKVTFFDAQGAKTSVLTARQGLYNIATGALDARGQVDVLGTDGKRVQTEHLLYDKAANVIRSDTAFVYDSREYRGTGSRFLSDPEFRNVTVDEPKGRQRGKGTLVPGQE